MQSEKSSSLFRVERKKVPVIFYEHFVYDLLIISWHYCDAKLIFVSFLFYRKVFKSLTDNESHFWLKV